MAFGADFQELQKQFTVKNFEATCSIMTAGSKEDGHFCSMKFPAWHATQGQSFQFKLSWKSKKPQGCIVRPDGDSFLGLSLVFVKNPAPSQTYGRLFVELVNVEPSASRKREGQAFVSLTEGFETGWTQELNGTSHSHMGLTLNDVFDVSKGWLQSGCLCLEAKLQLATEGNTPEEIAVGVQPNPKMDLLQNWASLYQSGEGSDVIIRVKNEEIRAHALVLKTQSKVFAATLSSPMQESAGRQIVIDDLEPFAVRATIGFLYSGEVDEEFLKSHANALSVLETAHRYDIPSLESMCIRHLSLGLDVNSVAEWLHISDLIGNTEFRGRCLNFIHGHIAEVQETDGYATYILPRPALLAEILSSMFPPAKRQRADR